MCRPDGRHVFLKGKVQMITYLPLFNQKKPKLMQTKGQLMKSLNTAFLFSPPSILSLTIYQTHFIKNGKR